jgi:hypothetical protein
MHFRKHRTHCAGATSSRQDGRFIREVARGIQRSAYARRKIVSVVRASGMWAVNGRASSEKDGPST